MMHVDRLTFTLPGGNALPAVVDSGDSGASGVLDAGACRRAPLVAPHEDLAPGGIAAALARGVIEPDVSAGAAPQVSVGAVRRHGARRASPARRRHGAPRR